MSTKTILKQSSDFFYEIQDENIFFKFSKIVEEALTQPILYVQEEEYRSQIKFKDIDVIVVDTGVCSVVYKGVAQELGQDGRELLRKAFALYRKTKWEDKLKEVFKDRYTIYATNRGEL